MTDEQDHPATKISPALHPEIIRAARRGDTYAAIARDYGVTRQRIHQIVRGHLKRQKLEENGSQVDSWVPRDCAMCSKPVRPPRYRYCSQRCSDHARLVRHVTVYRPGHVRNLARYILTHSENKAKRRWAARVLQGKAGTKRWIMDDSKTYLIMKRRGMLDSLPPEIEVRSRRT